MDGYEIVNLKQDVEDSAVKFGYSPEMESRFATGAIGAGLSYQRLAPNARQPFGHVHNRQAEIYLLLDGTARLALNDEIVDLKTWDAVKVAPEVKRCFEAGPDGASILALNASDPAVGDAETLPGWWPEGAD